MQPLVNFYQIIIFVSILKINYHCEFSCSIFYGNDGGTTPAFSALYAPLILSGHNIFNFNKGGALQVRSMDALIYIFHSYFVI